jgi:hypothetical protein
MAVGTDQGITVPDDGATSPWNRLKVGHGDILSGREGWNKPIVRPIPRGNLLLGEKGRKKLPCGRLKAASDGHLFNSGGELDTKIWGDRVGGEKILGPHFVCDPGTDEQKVGIRTDLEGSLARVEAKTTGRIF